MKKNCFCLILLLAASALWGASRIELQSDSSASAEVFEDKAKQFFAVSLSFKPVISLDVVTNNEMTGVLARFFAEEALSSYLKSSKTIDFSNVKCIVHKKSEMQYSLTYEIPVAAVSEAKVAQQSIAMENIKKYLASVSSDTLLQDFRSTCFHDLRIAEAVFIEQIKNCKDKKQLARKINDAFSALIKKINDDDALFLSEKEELLSKAKSIKKYLLKKLSDVQQDAAISCPTCIRNADVLPEFQPFIFCDPILMKIGGCKVFQTDSGELFLISVGKTSAANQWREKIAEQKAYGEIAKYKNLEVNFFAQQTKDVHSKNGQIQERKVRKKKIITLHAAEYMKGMPTVGTWFSADDKAFFLAKGQKIR